MSQPSFADMIVRLRRGDETAATWIFQEFAGRLIALARQRLNAQVRQKVDPEDVMQSVWKSFFRRQADGQFDLADWDSLWALLTVLTLRKCGHRIRHYRAACRNVQREMPPTADEEARASWQAIAREPTPAEAAALADTVEELLRGLDTRDRRVVELSLQGYTVPDIADQVGVAERTVFRCLERIKGRLERLGARDEET